MPKFKTVIEMDDAFRKLSTKEQAFIYNLCNFLGQYGPASGVKETDGLQLIQDYIIDPSKNFPDKI